MALLVAWLAWLNAAAPAAGTPSPAATHSTSDGGTSRVVLPERRSRLPGDRIAPTDPIADATVSLAGRVVDETGVGLAGVAVAILGRSDAGELAELSSVISTGGGEYALSLERGALPRDGHVYSGSADDRFVHERFAAAPLSDAAARSARFGDLVVRRVTRHLEVRVMGRTLEPVRARIWAQTSRGSRRTETGSDGVALVPLADGDSVEMLRVTPVGYAMLVKWPSPEETVVECVCVESGRDVQIRLSAAGEVLSGRPLDLAEVYGLRLDWLPEVRTDRHGLCRLESVPLARARYRVDGVTESGAKATGAWPAAEFWSAIDTASTLDLRVLRDRALEVLVETAAEGRVVADAEVWAFGENGTYSRARSGDRGIAQFPSVIGRTRVRVLADGFAEAALDVQNDDDAVRVALARGRECVGRVLSDGVAVEGVRVYYSRSPRTAHASGADVPVAAVRSDKDGAFRLRGVPIERGLVVLGKGGFLSLQRPADDELGAIALTRCGTVGGWVTGPVWAKMEIGNPVGTYVAEWQHYAGGRAAQEFLRGRPATGRVVVAAVDSGRALLQLQRIEVRPGDRLTVRFSGGGSLTGSVIATAHPTTQAIDESW